MNYPNLLIVRCRRAKAAESSSRGLLLEKLLRGWSRNCLAQVVRSARSSDQGLVGRYLLLGRNLRARMSLSFLAVPLGEGNRALTLASQDRVRRAAGIAATQTHLLAFEPIDAQHGW